MKIEDLQTTDELTEEEGRKLRGGWGQMLAARWTGWRQARKPSLMQSTRTAMTGMEEEEEDLS